jgi:hypothetical protein
VECGFHGEPAVVRGADEVGALDAERVQHAGKPADELRWGSVLGGEPGRCVQRR